jgi:hypothetical protein
MTEITERGKRWQSDNGDSRNVTVIAEDGERSE